MLLLDSDVELEEQRSVKPSFQGIEGTLEERVFQSKHAFQSKRALQSRRAHSSEDTFLKATALPRRPSLSGLLRRAGPLPAYTVLLGVCNDGLPLFFDLSDHAPGSILVRGDIGGTRQLLRSLLVSLGRLNRPEKASFCLLTPRPEAWPAFLGEQRCLSVLAPTDSSSGDMIRGLAGIAAQRQEAKIRPGIFNHRNGISDHPAAALILAIDDLASAVQPQTEQVLGELHWLVRHGPETGVWVVATLLKGSEAGVEPTLLELFGTQVTGLAGVHLPNGPDVEAKQDAPKIAGVLPEQGLFQVRLGRNWIQFSVPDID